MTQLRQPHGLWLSRNIVEGYKIPFFDLPENFVIPNRSSTFKFKDFVEEAISELIELGCVSEVELSLIFINPLHVVLQFSGKCRLLLDLSFLNRFVWKQSVRYEDICTASDLFQSGYFFFTFDLKSANRRVENYHRQYWVFLGVSIQSSNTLFLMFCLLACLPLRTFSLSACSR